MASAFAIHHVGLQLLGTISHQQGLPIQPDACGGEDHPSAVKPCLEGFVDLDDPELAPYSILHHSAMLCHNITTAGEKLLIAHICDTLRHAGMHGGGMLPVL